MATAVRKGKGKKKAAAKGTAKKKSSGGRTRATNEELDKQAAEVVRLRDKEDKSWKEVVEITGLPMSRMRGLYNRGGGVSTGERKGAAKAAEKASGKKGATKAKAKSKTKAKKRPS
jgi:hypothetical protein